MKAELFLFDKINRRKARYYFTDSEGNFYLKADPYGLDMGGKISIIPVSANHPGYEVREVGKIYITETEG